MCMCGCLRRLTVGGEMRGENTPQFWWYYPDCSVTGIKEIERKRGTWLIISKAPFWVTMCLVDVRPCFHHFYLDRYCTRKSPGIQCRSDAACITPFIPQLLVSCAKQLLDVPGFQLLYSHCGVSQCWGCSSIKL